MYTIMKNYLTRHLVMAHRGDPGVRQSHVESN